MYHAYQRSAARREQAGSSDRHVTFLLPPESRIHDQATSSEPQVIFLLPPDFRLNAPIPDADDAMMVRTGAVHHRSARRHGINPIQPRFHPERPHHIIEEANSSTSSDEGQRVHPPLTHPDLDGENPRHNTERTDRVDNEWLTDTDAPCTQLTLQQTQGSVITQEDLKTLEILDKEENGSDELSENLIPLDVAAPLNNYSATRVFACDACLVGDRGSNESYSTEEMTLHPSAPMDRRMFACDSRHVEAGPEPLGLEAVSRNQALDEPSVDSRIHLEEKVSADVGLSSPEELFCLQQDDEGLAEEQENHADLESTQQHLRGHESQENESREAVLSSQEIPLQTLVDDQISEDVNKPEEGRDVEPQQPFLEEKSTDIIFERNRVSEMQTDSSPRDGSVFPTPTFQSPSLNDQDDRNIGDAEGLDERFMRELKHFLESFPDALSRIQRGISINKECLEKNIAACQAKDDPPLRCRRAPCIDAIFHPEAENHEEHDLNPGRQKCPGSIIFHDNCLEQGLHCLKKDPPCQRWKDPPFVNKADPPMSVITDSLHNGRAKDEGLPAVELMHFQHLLQTPTCQKEDPPCRKWDEPPFVNKKDPPATSRSARSLQDDTSCSDSFSESSHDDSIEFVLQPIKASFRRVGPNPAPMQQEYATTAPMQQEDVPSAPMQQEEASPLLAQKVSQAIQPTFPKDAVLPKKTVSSMSLELLSGSPEAIYQNTGNLYPLSHSNMEEANLDRIYPKTEAAVQIPHPTVLGDFKPQRPAAGAMGIGAIHGPSSTVEYSLDDRPWSLIEFEQQRRSKHTNATKISVLNEKGPGAARVDGINNSHWRNLVYVPEGMQSSQQRKPTSAMQSTAPKQQGASVNEKRDIVLNENLNDRSRNAIGFERQRQAADAIQDSVSNLQVPGAVRVHGNNSRQQNLTAPAGLPLSQRPKPGAVPIPRRASQVTVAGSDEDTVNAPSRVVAEIVDEEQLLRELLSRISPDVVHAENVAAVTAESQDQSLYDLFLSNAIAAGVDGDENGKKRTPWPLRLFGRTRRQETSSNDRSSAAQ